MSEGDIETVEIVTESSTIELIAKTRHDNQIHLLICVFCIPILVVGIFIFILFLSHVAEK